MARSSTRNREFAAVEQRERVELGASLIGQRQERPPSIGRVGPPLDQSVLDRPIGQLARRVELQLQHFGEFAGRRVGRSGVTTDGEQELVLCRCQTVVAGGLLGEGQEAPKRVAELGERAVVGVGQRCGRRGRSWPPRCSVPGRRR